MNKDFPSNNSVQTKPPSLPTDGQNSKGSLADIIKYHSKTFYFATSFLPKKKKEAIWALYAFCRTTDDLVDQNPNVTPADLKAWRKELYKEQPQNDILALFRQVIDEYKIPWRYVNALVDGCARDLTQHTYQDFDELGGYCYQVASTVGLMSAHIIGFDPAKEDEMRHHAILAGVALQMTNILRDVGEDLERGRIYLPREEFLAFNCNLDDPRGWPDSENFKKLMAFQIKRTRELYEEGRKGLKYLDSCGRFAVAAALRTYEEILTQIEKNDYDVFSKRAYVPTLKKLTLLPEAWLSAL